MKSFRALTLLAGSAALCVNGQTPNFNTGQAARLVVGQKNFTFADYGATNQLLGSPSGIAYANGTLWVADSNRLGSTPNNNRILRFSDAGSFPKVNEAPDISGSTCGACRGVASLALGQPDFITTNPNLSQNGLRRPSGVATDGTVLAVADTDNNRVLIWLKLPQATNQPADVVVGQADFTHNSTSVPPTQTSLRGPIGVWIAGGKLFVADSQDNRILIYNRIPTANNTPADVVIGQANFTAFVQPDLTAVQPTTAGNNMQTPVSVSTDGKRMFVSDLGQNRVLIWNNIPTSNGVAADVVLGQPDLNSAVENNSFNTTGTAAAPVYASVLCASNGTDATTGAATYPARCAATLSFPRFALSDGTRLFVADGGNDRVLIYNTIPTTNGAAADIILGQPDQFSDNAGDNPDGTNAFQTPASLAFDGVNLYVSDTYNRRVEVFSPALPSIPLNGVRNAASQEIYALGTISIAGGITDKDTITVTVAAAPYTYTVAKTDTLEKVVQGLVALINKNPDANVIATGNLSADTIILTARKPGAAGAVTYAATVSTNSTLVPTAGGTALNIFLENPSQIAPNTIIEVSGTNLCETSGAADMTQTYLPFAIKGCTLYVDGVAAPLLYASPTQINAQLFNEATDRTSVSIYARSLRSDGSVVVSTPVAATIVPQNPGLFALPGTDPRVGIVFHATSSAFDLVSVDGAIQAGDIASITVANSDASVTNTYSYTVLTGDTLATVRDALIALINASDPLVRASVSNEFTRIAVKAIQLGTAGEGIAVTTAVTTDVKNTAGAAILVTAFNPTLCCSNVEGAQVTQENPAVPGELLYTYATGLGVTEPQDQETGRIFRGGSSNPPAVPVDSILTGGSTANVGNVSLVPGTVGVYSVQFQLSQGLSANAATPMTIAQQAFVSNVTTFPVQVPGNASKYRITPDTTTATVGATVNFTIEALDYKNNLATTYTNNVTISSSDTAAGLPGDFAVINGVGSFSAIFNTPGTQTVTATDTVVTFIQGTSAGVTVSATGAKVASPRLPARRIQR